MNPPDILIAGIGNVFLGDDAFGVEVVRHLAQRPQPPGVRVVDFGIRGFDLALALLGRHDLVILVDAARRGEKPGTLYLLEPGNSPQEPGLPEAHGMIPSQVFRTVQSMGGILKNVFIVGCEPESFGPPESGRMGLSDGVRAAVGPAAEMIESLVRKTLAGRAVHA